MAVILFVVATAAVLGIAAYAVGQTAKRLAGEPPASLFEFDEAVEFVATALPGDLSSQLSYGDVRTVIAAHLDELARQEKAGGDLVFVDDDLAVRLAARPDVAARAVSVQQVEAVLAAEAQYLDAIGAVAGEADERAAEPTDPDGGENPAE